MTNPKHPRSIAAGLGVALVTVANVIFGWHPTIEVLGAENTIAAYLTSLIPGNF